MKFPTPCQCMPCIGSRWNCVAPPYVPPFQICLRRMTSLYGGSGEPNRPAAELDAMKRRTPALAGQNRKGAGQGAGGDDVAGCEWRIDRIVRQQADEMAQRR